MQSLTPVLIVDNVEPAAARRRAMEGTGHGTSRGSTFYGMDEIIVRGADGNIITCARGTG